MFIYFDLLGKKWFPYYKHVLILTTLHYIFRSVINGKASTAAALPKFIDALTLSQLEGEGADHPPIGFTSPKIFSDYAPDIIVPIKKWYLLHI